MTQQHGLTWGALDFVSQVPTADGYKIEALSEGTSLGNPDPIIEVVKSLLTDGSIAVLQNWDNRTAPIRLRLSAPVATAGPALAAAEKALFLNVLSDAPPPLVWTPPADDAAVSVFDVVVARLDRDESEGWDLEEVQREYRYYLLTLTCLPFARPETTVVVPALAPAPVTPTTVNIDTCDSTTGWAAAFVDMGGTSFTATGGYIVAAGDVVGSGSTSRITLTRTGAVTMGATPYLRVSALMLQNGTTPAPAPVVTASFNGGAAAAPVATAASAIAGATDFYFQPPASFTTAAITAAPYWTPVDDIALRIYHVARTDKIIGAGSTTRQQPRSVTVRGSAPTQAAIQLFDATPAALGTEILVHTSRNTAWQPNLRPRRISGSTVTVDAAMVSGARDELGAGAGASLYRIPANLLTEGTYALMARVSIAIAGVVSWQARMVTSAGGTTVGSSRVVTGSASVPATAGYRVLSLGALSLPVLDVEGDQMVELILTGEPFPSNTMIIDEAWLFGLDDGALTWIKDADSLTWIEIRSPELDSPRPAVFGGTGTFGTNPVCIDWKCQSFGAHRFDPGQMQVFTVTSTSLVSQSEMEYYRRYHSNVLDEAA